MHILVHNEMDYKRWVQNFTIGMCCNVVIYCVTVTRGVYSLKKLTKLHIYCKYFCSAYTHYLIDILFCQKQSDLALAFRTQTDKLMFDLSGVSGLVVDENRFLPRSLWLFTATAAYALHCTFWLNRRLWSTGKLFGQYRMDKRRATNDKCQEVLLMYHEVKY